MSRNVLMQAQREDQLRASFQEAADRECRPAAHVLRQLMEAYGALLSSPEARKRSWRKDMVERAAVSVVNRVPGRAPHFVDENADLEAMVERQFGWGIGVI